MHAISLPHLGIRLIVCVRNKQVSAGCYLIFITSLLKSGPVETGLTGPVAMVMTWPSACFVASHLLHSLFWYCSAGFSSSADSLNQSMWFHSSVGKGAAADSSSADIIISVHFSAVPWAIMWQPCHLPALRTPSDGLALTALHLHHCFWLAWTHHTSMAV